jgi:hypothetical protein
MRFATGLGASLAGDDGLERENGRGAGASKTALMLRNLGLRCGRDGRVKS